jgi:hypothetical protein
MELPTGSKDWSEGALGDAVKAAAPELKPYYATGLAAVYQSNGDRWVFYQGANLQLVGASWRGDKKEWIVGAIQTTDENKTISMAPGASIAAVLLSRGTTTDISNEVISIAYHAADLRINEVRSSGSDKWAPGMQFHPEGHLRIILC